MGEQKQNDEARREMLAAIRRHLAVSAPFDEAQNERPALDRIGVRANAEANDAISTRQPSAVLAERFQQALAAVAGRCAIVRDEYEAAEAVQQILRQRNARRIAVSNSRLAQRVIERVKWDAELIENADPLALFDCDVGITGAQWAVAETGTLVL